MFSWKINFDHKESPGDSNLISIFIKVEFEEVKMKYILNIDGLFASVIEGGFQPLFTCECGNFGCGGYYMKVVHEEYGIKLLNSYKPVKAPREEDLLDIFEYEISWEDLYIMSSTVFDYMIDIKKKNPQYNMCCGSYGSGLIDMIDNYESILDNLRNRYED